jgi:antitoxin component YwqK of YwqJK toxin-antitoxin module
MLTTLLVALLVAAGAMGQSTESSPADTLNQVDDKGRRMGYWRVVAPEKGKPEYADGALIEEGRYQNGRRSGLWLRYWPTGRLKSEIHYEGGRPRGPYKTYHANGNVEEQGTWDLDRNTGTFQRYHPNGNLAQDFIFSGTGLRNGNQRYYHENGRLAVEVHIRNGREEGRLRRYDTEGNLVQDAVFADGNIDEAKSHWLQPVPKSSDVQPDADAPLAPVVSREERPNVQKFREDGHNTLYDKELRLSMSGEFRKGRLWEGRRYHYNKDGMLYRIELYRHGRYIGDAPITDDDQ